MGAMGKYLSEFTDEYMKFAFLISVDYMNNKHSDTWIILEVYFSGSLFLMTLYMEKKYTLGL